MWLVIGAGISGMAAAKLLKKQNKAVMICDDHKIADDKKHELRSLGIRYVEESQDLKLLDGVNYVIPSPGVNLKKNPLTSTAQDRNIALVSDIDLALKEFTGRAIAVTGTNGKSTVTKMIEHTLKKNNLRAVACGNIGLPLTTLALNQQSYDVYVIEISSYQLELAQIIPDVAVFTSFSFDHLSRHGSMENYFKIKWSMFARLKKSGLAILNDEIIDFANQYRCTLPQRHKSLDAFSFDFSHLSLSAHDQANATQALLSCEEILKKNADSLINDLKDFEPLPFRFQTILTIGNKKIINDSKSTNTESVITALKSCSTPVILMLGGQSKGESFEIIKSYQSKIYKIITFGQSSPIIGTELGNTFALESFDSLKTALNHLLNECYDLKHDILFSPGCASFDEFKNFEDRGQFFSNFFLKRNHLG